MTEEHIVGTSGLKIVYGSREYTLAEDIQYTLGDNDNQPIEPRAQLVAPEGITQTMYWYLPGTEALDRWIAKENYNDNISGIVTCD